MAGLFTPLHLRDIRLNNRILISPMWQYSGQDGHSTDFHLMHYGRFAEGGAGLVFQEGTTVEKRARGTLGDLGIWSDSFIPELRRIVSLVKRAGAVPGIQIMHPGHKVMEEPPWEPTRWLSPEKVRAAGPSIWEALVPSAPSKELAREAPRQRVMTTGDIEDVTIAFHEAARRADEAGYEVLELHAAHGYLLHAFLSEATNHRTDSYGGTFSNRIRLLVDCVDAVREVWPQSKPLAVRISCVDGAGWELNDTMALARILKSHGVDLLDCSAGGIGDRVLDRRSSYAPLVKFAAEIRREVNLMTNAVGLIVHAQHAEQIISSGMADTIAIGREALYNPNWPIDAAHKLGIDANYSRLPARQRFWFHYREQGMDGFRPSTYGNSHGLEGSEAALEALPLDLDRVNPLPIGPAVKPAGGSAGRQVR